MPVTVSPGVLPPFRQRRTAFVANLLSLFFGNEYETQELQQTVGNLESYGGRLVPVLSLLNQGGPCDLVLESAPDPALLDYFEKALELQLPKVSLLDHEIYLGIGRHLAEERPVERLQSSVPLDLRSRQLDSIDGFVTDETLAHLARFCETETLASVAGSRRGNNKGLLHDFLISEGLPVFDTLHLRQASELPAALVKMRATGYRQAVIKSQIGASGIGIQKLSTEPTVPSPLIADHYFFEGYCLLQGWLEPGIRNVTAIKSPSVQLFLDDLTGIHLYDVTEQILSHDSVHEGNISPPPCLENQPAVLDRMLDQSEQVARWLYQQGYRGTASVDFLIAEKSGSEPAEVYVCEINARITGATYPAVLARHFIPHGAWMHRNLQFSEPIAAQQILYLLSSHHHLFQPQSTGGILPVNFIRNDAGLVTKGQFLCLGKNIRQCQKFLVYCEEELPIDWDYIRD